MAHPAGWDDPDRRDAALDRLLEHVEHGYPLRVRPTDAELEVLRCLSVGMTEGMAAEALGQRRDTVMRKCVKAQRRLAAKNRTHAVALAIRAGYIA